MITTGKDFFIKLNTYIEAATKEILISTFKIETGKGSEHKSLQTTINLIAKRARQGLQIKLICPGPPQNSPIARQNRPALTRLHAAGVHVRTETGHLSMHAKIFILDRQILAIGSHNLSRGACATNWEMTIFSENAADISTAATLYLLAWDHANPSTNPVPPKPKPTL